MKKCLIVYFSQNGTTRSVAERIAAGLSSANIQTDVFRMDDPQCPNPLEYDMFGIGFPVYFFRPPFNVLDFINKLPELKGLPTFVFMLYGSYFGDAHRIIKQFLTRKGAVEAGSFACRGRNLFLGYLRQGYLFSPEAPTSQELTQAELFGKECARFLNEDASLPSIKKQPMRWIYRLERLFTNRWLARNLYSRFFKADKNCKKCGVCVKACPMGNISQEEKEWPQFGRNCLLCLTCEMKCPQGAIVSPISWSIFYPFLFYNVRNAAKDPQIHQVRVEHKLGVTREL